MDIPGDIDLTEARDFSDGTIGIGKPNHRPSKIPPWERDELEYYIKGNVISVTNSGPFPFLSNIMTSTNTRLPNINDFRIAYTRGTSNTSILYQITNDDDLYFTNDSDPERIWFKYEREFMKQKLPTDEEIELEAWYADMPISRDVFRYTFISEELSTAEQFIGLSSVIEEITKQRQEIESVIDEITPLLFDDLINMKVIHGATFTRVFDGIREGTEDNPFDKSIPWE